MAGVVSSSMPMWMVENDARQNRAHITFSEGQDEIVRFGGFRPAVIERLHWMRSVLLAVLAAVVAALPTPLDLRAMCAGAVEMGDEVHNRNRAATSLLLRTLAPVFGSWTNPRPW